VVNAQNYGRRRRPKSFGGQNYGRCRRPKSFFDTPFYEPITVIHNLSVFANDPVITDETGDDFDADDDDDEEVMRQHLALCEAHANLFNQA
jgi:hypothetical protein